MSTAGCRGQVQQNVSVVFRGIYNVCNMAKDRSYRESSAATLPNKQARPLPLVVKTIPQPLAHSPQTLPSYALILVLHERHHPRLQPKLL